GGKDQICQQGMPVFSRIRVLALVLFIALLTACAQGEIGPNNEAENDTGGEQTDTIGGGGDAGVDGADTTDDSGTTDSGSDTSSPDTSDTTQGDTGADTDDPDSDTGTDDDTADPDSGGPCDQVNCSSGVCDPNTGSCVDCLADSDCSAGVCDTTNNTCIGCASDGDCGADEYCHDTAAVCIAPCCEETVEDSFTAVSYSHNYFDIAVTPGGDPSIIFGDRDADVLKFAQPVNGQWLSQTIPNTETSNSGVDVRLALDSSGNPHVIASRYGSLKHLWRDNQGWNSHDLLTLSGDSGYVDIVIDSNDTVHMVALVDYGDQIRYATYDAQGQRTGEDITLPGTDPNPPVWTNIGVTSSGTPVVSFQIGLDKTLIIAEKPGSSWQFDTAAQDVAQVHGLAVDHNDEPVVSYRKNSTNDGLRLLRRSGGTWSDTLVVDDPDHGYSSDVAVGPLGDPHVIYMASGSAQYDNPMYYARWNGAAWESIQVAGVDRAFYPRIAVDDTRTPHVVVYDPPRDSIEYVRLDTL
ncbi:MAG: hypothetical protein ACQEVA_23625, partial [Myxococcota bacterium]